MGNAKGGKYQSTNPTVFKYDLLSFKNSRASAIAADAVSLSV